MECVYIYMHLRSISPSLSLYVNSYIHIYTYINVIPEALDVHVLTNAQSGSCRDCRVDWLKSARRGKRLRGRSTNREV